MADDDDDLFSWKASRDAKKEGMNRVNENADHAWKRAALECVKETAERRELLTSDDVMRRLFRRNVTTHELRALGPVMQRAAKAGWIEAAMLPPRNSSRPSLHASPRRVWRSMIWDGVT